MPLPEGYLPRKGDILVLHVKTRFDVRDDDLEGRKLYVNVHPVGESRYHHFRVHLDEIERIWCRHWETGAKIQLKRREPAERRPGEVLAVEGEFVWVKFSDSGERFMTLHANQIEPREEPPEAQQPAFDVAGAAVEMAAIPEPARTNVRSRF
jgi:hypothetical protein